MARPARGLSNIEEYPESRQAANQRNLSPPGRSGMPEAGTSRPRNDTTIGDVARSQSTGQMARYGGLRPSNSSASMSTSRSVSGITSNAGSTASRGLPLKLRSVAPAPAVTFTSPATAIHARSLLAGLAGSYTDDRESVIADDGDMDPDSSRDTLFMLRGGIDGAIDRSHLAKYGWSAIPGFPLSKDILADDTKSVRSSSTRLHRVDTIDEHLTNRSEAQIGLQTSADAIVRRMRGEGLSRKFWMADENAKECRECLSVFTPFRRKHHCRICGQIFCGRCAAHIIKGKRFNFEGMIRVCNFCKRMLEEYDRHEREGQHQQKLNVAQRASKNPNRVQPDKDMISAPLEAQIRSPQAQFAANHLFASASAGPSSFSAGIHQTMSAPFGFADNDSIAGVDASNGVAGDHDKIVSAEQARKRKPDAAPVAPFRKGMDKEELAPARPDPEDDEPAASQLTEANMERVPSAVGSSRQTPQNQTPDMNESASTAVASPANSAAATQPGASTSSRAKEGTTGQAGVAFPSSGGPANDAPSAIQSTSDYPRLRLVSETSRPVTRSRMRSLRTIASLDPSQASALIRSSFQSNGRTESPIPPLPHPHEDDDAGPDHHETSEFYRELRICSEGITPALLEASITHRALEHLSKMMAQTLRQSGIHNERKWCDVLLPFVLTTISRVKPDAREDQSRDIREFVKIKRIPGGKPDDSEYVDGYVCTKHVATKRMAARIPLTNARIIVIRFPLDYHRGPNQFMSLEPLMAQEHEFIRILVARIIALRPQIVVVEKTVSRIALELLEKEGIVVVWSVKADAIRAISRCTQADIITSIDRLAFDPRIGRCRYFNVETFQHASFPGWRKSFMRFEGTPKQLGCTIVLRGADGERLSSVKKILAMMIFVAYNLRLEGHVMADEGAAMETIYSDSSLLNGSHPCGTVEAGTSNSAADELKRLADERDFEMGEEASSQLGRVGDDKTFVLRSRARILRALSIYETTLITSSVCIQIPAPYPILQLKRVNDRLMQLLAQQEAEELQRILKDEGKLQDRALTPPASITEIVDPTAPEEKAEDDDATPTSQSKPATADSSASIAAEAEAPMEFPSVGDVTPKYEVPSARIHDTIVEEGEESSSDASPSSPRSSTPQPAPASASKEQSEEPIEEEKAHEDANDSIAQRREASDATVTIEMASPSVSGPNTTTPTPRPSSPVQSRQKDASSAALKSTGSDAPQGPASADTSITRSVSAPVSEVPTRTTSPGPGSILSHTSQGSTTTVAPSTASVLNTIKQQEQLPVFDLFSLLKAPSQIAKEAEFAITVDRHRASLVEWGDYLDIEPESVSPFNHKRIQIIVTRHCTLLPRPCEGPNLASIEFYGEHDETLGEHIERLAANSAKGCATKGCGKNNVLHYNTFVHNRIRIQVVLERFVCPLPNEENRLLSWSYCKVCENATPVALVTAETWSFSFAKYLELYFYRHDHCKTQLCEHDFYRDQVRYFAYQNMAVRFHSEEVDNLFEVTMPHFKLFIDPEVQCNIKNEETAAFVRKSQAYWDSVMARIRALGNDACSDAAGINRDKNRATISEMIKRCELDRREVEALVAELYEFSPATDVLCLNQARRMLQEKVVKWDIDFIEFEKNCIPSEKDIRRITTTHLKRLFSEKDPSEAARSETASSILPPAAEIDESSTDAAESKPKGRDAEKTDQERPRSTSNTNTGSANIQAAEALALAGADLSLVPMLSDLVTHTVETPASEMPPILAGPGEILPTTHQTAGNGDTGPEAVSRSKTVPTQLNKVGRADASKYRDSNFDDETDAADLSPVEVRPMISRRALSNPVTAPALPTYGKSRGSLDPVGFPRADESSCTGSELVGSVTGLIRRFDSPRRNTTGMPASSSGAGLAQVGPTDATASRAGVNGSIRRPSLRRGKTEEVVSTHAKELSRSRKASTSHDDGLDSNVNSPTAANSASGRSSRLPRAKRSDSGASVATVGRRSGSATPVKGAPLPPPSSYRPPKGEGLKAGPRPIIGRSGASAAAATLAAASSAASATAGNRSQSGAYQSDGAGSSRNAGGSMIGSRVPVARRSEHGPGTRSRVSTIAKHFDRISKEAERERERQHRLLLAQRAKRARPVAMTRARVEVFSSVREAVRDDESEPDSAAENSADDGASADDESEADEDDDSDEDASTEATSLEAKRGKLAMTPGHRSQNHAHAKQRKLLGSEQAQKHGEQKDGGDTIKQSALARKGKEGEKDSSIKGAHDPSTISAAKGSGAEIDPSASVTSAATAATPMSSSLADDACTIASQETGHATNISPPAASELESDAQSIAASSMTTTNNTTQLTLPSYLRSGFTSDSDSMPSLERSFLKTLSGFWAFRTGEMVPLEYPMLNSEHVFADSDIIFREDEPTSIVAFTLSSTQYKERLKGMRNETPRVKEKDQVSIHDKASIAGSTDGWGIVDMDTNELEGSLKKEGRHFRCEFESGSTRLWCKILFAEQFDALRRTCGCDVSVVESLSRCFKWDSSGGKSGSAFLKTRDHRLVVKQLSRFEMDAFSKFAPQYFAYMSQCLSTGRRTALAKIFGCFRIGFRNPQTGKSIKLDCFVMENLFYGLEGIRSYDLKGSTRNRYVQETGRDSEVLLDENLIETNHLNPIFIREHSKKLLRASLYNDSLFLADMNVMDYSLMVGVDRQSKQLVVGIIDFVRTYTWDKRVESFVKETALLGGAGKGEPTIITPPDYRTRFLTFIDKALLLMPDHWVEDWAL